MPRKTVSRKSESSVSESSTTPVVVTPKSVKVTKTKTKTRVKKNVVEEEEVVEEEVVSDVESTTQPANTRRQPTRESVVESFEELVHSIDTEIARLRETPQTKTKGVKFLRSLGKRVKTLRAQTTRVMKQRVRTNRKNNNNSGFLKPVQISKDMAKFTGWDPETLHSRVDVTKYVCNYIRENDLQNPDDRRQILVDNKLSKLLKYDSKNETEPLTYYRIQTHLKPHFVKTDHPVSA